VTSSRPNASVFAAAIAIGIASLAFGCGKSTGTTTSTGAGGAAVFCKGGFIRMVDGKPTCEGLCDPSKCANPGNVCVDNFCALLCTTLADCPSGQDCVAATEDGMAMKPASVCAPSGKAKIGLPCPLKTECNGELACPDGSSCDTTQCGGATCAPDPAACAGVAHCVVGKCASDGSACVVPGCDPSACKPLFCLSSGIGDATAFCTMLDCQKDDDCGDGFWCAQRRDAHQICGAPKPDPNFCGTTTDPCVDPSKNAANGTTFAQGSVCAERNQCRKRAQCDACKTDNDCALTPGTSCAGGFCAFACGGDVDCANGFQCTSGHCAPRGGSCQTGSNFCDACRADSDCKSGYICALVDIGGLRACYPATVPCMVATDCPVAPSGANGSCIAANKSCSFPVNGQTNLAQCFCGNTGEACFASGDCCSKTCSGANVQTLTPGTCM